MRIIDSLTAAVLMAACYFWGYYFGLREKADRLRKRRLRDERILAESQRRIG